MAYEEASVAGETPDRSKQRKSSGNPTGAEPSVPAPAPEERDPRLAVAREVPAAREDQATAVFSTKAVAETKAAGAAGSGDSTRGSGESEGSEDSGRSEGSGVSGDSGGAESGDARLRAAVAAWVASADDEAPGGPEAGKPAETAASDDEGAASGEDATSDGEENSSEAEPSGGSAAADEAVVAAGPAGDGGAEDGAEDGASAESGTTVEEASAGDEAEGSHENDEGDEGDEADENGRSEVGDGAEGAQEADETAGADGSSGGAGDSRDAVRPSGAEGDAEDSPKNSTKGSSEDSDTSEPADSTGTTDSATAADDASDSDSDSDSDRDAEDEPADETPEVPSRGVDQATAVFKALPPKAVDQPTTMLKLGDHKPGAKKPEGKPEDKPEDKKPEAKPSANSSEDSAANSSAKPAAKPAAKPEGDAERTSKFVALKPLDDTSSSGGTRPPAKQSPAAKPAPGARPTAPGAESATPEKAAAAGNAGPERTTQQPLPPRPPLDLLAELTNTPPPPETPVRTAVRRVKIWTPLVLLLVVVFAVVQAVRPLPTPTLALTTKETVSFEGEKPSMPWPGQGQAAMDVNGIGTFGSTGNQKPVPIASIAKVMTVYLVLRDHPLKKGGDPGPKIPVDAAAEKHYETGKAENESVVRVREGQKITEYEALQAVMLPSANNVAKLLARWDTKSDSEDEFVAKMNKTAKELGMKNTHYTDPSGLDKTTVSTAEDLVKLGRAAMEDPVFNEISRQPSYKDLNGDKQNNFFGLVPTVAIGIKTGTTTAAGGNILFAAEKKIGGETRTIIGAALGQYGKQGVANIDEVTGVTRKLIEAGQAALKAKTIVKKGDVVGQVDDGLGGTTPVVATKDVEAAGWSGLTVKLKLGEKAGDTIPHTAEAATVVGVLSVGDGKEGAVEVPVALQKDLAEPGFGAKLQRVG